MDAFENLNKKFDTESFTENVDKISKEIDIVKKRKNEIVDTLRNNTSGFTKEEQEYLIEENLSLMKSLNNVIDKLETDIKYGTPVNAHEVFSRLTTSKVNLLRELRELYKTIREINQQSPEALEDKKKNKNNIEMSATDLLKLVKEAQKSSSLNAIDAKFEVMEEKDDGTDDIFKVKKKDI